ncbi:DUF7532 family protein [Halorientalis litorea]|jgi:hypothetical protein|uniref:DUF7532 family protein n=1 Tax=Halorientalis litorea TaxID=2931977 RepID=UPI001FF21D73|nr:hypothetical protein [Halorientalis litorea]
MHFDQRTQQALREVGLSQADIEAASEAVVAATADDAARIESFFADVETVHSDMDIAHSTGSVVEHDVEYIDLFTHAADLRGYLRFSNWGVPVEDGRVLSEETVELTLGPTVDDRVRFTTDPDSL